MPVNYWGWSFGHQTKVVIVQYIQNIIFKQNNAFLYFMLVCLFLLHCVKAIHLQTILLSRRLKAWTWLFRNWNYFALHRVQRKSYCAQNTYVGAVTFLFSNLSLVTIEFISEIKSSIVSYSSSIFNKLLSDSFYRS